MRSPSIPRASYGFAIDEIPFDPEGQLSESKDPKTAWAEAHPEWFPLEVNRAPREALLRVPGIGPRSARQLVALRQRERIRTLAALGAAGARWRVAAPYLLLDGRRPSADNQLSLF
jgi:predicted DNA-binding helix-hairpin-helix protein